MGAGFLKIVVTAGTFLIPVPNAAIVVSQSDKELYHLTTDAFGAAESVSLEAPDIKATLDPDNKAVCCARCDIEIRAAGLAVKIIRGVMIFDTEVTLMQVTLRPQATYDYTDYTDAAADQDDGFIEEVFLPEHALLLAEERLPDFTNVNQHMPAGLAPSIPERITVHLGAPNTKATDVTISFRNYIKNVCSHEIYPSWPPAALEANIYCQISIALNRIAMEWYRGRGYSFDITSQIGYDQYYVYQGEVFANIDYLVDQVFNRYVSKEGFSEPFYTEYCSGSGNIVCPGLKQWGTVNLAQQGLNPLEILKYYYPTGIQLNETDRINGAPAVYPGYTLRKEMTGEPVRTMQTYLNHISLCFPAIEQIDETNGYFGQETESAVKAFQATREFGFVSVSGIIDKTTWYKIAFEYSSVINLGELEYKSQAYNVTRTPPTSTVTVGAKGPEVRLLQFLLNFISHFYAEIPPTKETGDSSRETGNSVRAFQTAFGLPANSIVDPKVWQTIYAVYWGINDSIPLPNANPSAGQNTAPAVLMETFAGFFNQPPVISPEDFMTLMLLAAANRRGRSPSQK